MALSYYPETVEDFLRHAFYVSSAGELFIDKNLIGSAADDSTVSRLSKEDQRLVRLWKEIDAVVEPPYIRTTAFRQRWVELGEVEIEMEFAIRKPLGGQIPKRWTVPEGIFEEVPIKTMRLAEIFRENGYPAHRESAPDRMFMLISVRDTSDAMRVQEIAWQAIERLDLDEFLISVT